MAAFASGSDAYARTLEKVARVIRQTEAECGAISASQEELLARVPSLDSDGDADERDGASSRVVDADERRLRLLEEVTVEAGDISVSQEDLLARAPFLGGSGEEEEAEVFSTPPSQDQQSQGGKGEEDDINMCTQPFTQPPTSPASSSPSVSEKRRLSKPQKNSVWTRKRRGNKIRTPSPPPSPSPSPCPPPSPYVDPLFKAFLMIPSAPLPPPDGDILELALKAGIF